MCVMCRIILGTYCLSVCKWLGGLPVVFYAFLCGLLRCCGSWVSGVIVSGFLFGCYRSFLTLYVAIIHC